MESDERNFLLRLAFGDVDSCAISVYDAPARLLCVEPHPTAGYLRCSELKASSVKICCLA